MRTCPPGTPSQGRGRGSSAPQRDWCLGLGTAPGRGRERWRDRQNVTVEAAGKPERGPLETGLYLRAMRCSAGRVSAVAVAERAQGARDLSAPRTLRRDGRAASPLTEEGTANLKKRKMRW